MSVVPALALFVHESGALRHVPRQPVGGPGLHHQIHSRGYPRRLTASACSITVRASRRPRVGTANR